MGATDRIVVIGASLAGLRVAEALRSAGYDGSVRLIGAEHHLPYDRPPLSKGVLLGTVEPLEVTLRTPQEITSLELEMELGAPATGLRLAAGSVELAGGRLLPYDAAVIATGASPRTLHDRIPDLAGVHTLRTVEDAGAIREAFENGARVAVVGAGLIGAEVASAARQRGLDVTVIEALSVPMARALGEPLGEVCARLQRDHGVSLRCGVTVSGLLGAGRVEAVALGDGSRVPADVVVIGTGAVPTTGWLASSGLLLDNGVVCDAFGATTVAPNVFAAGDVARWTDPAGGGTSRSEHWTNAVEQAGVVARNLLAGPGARVSVRNAPYFWSDQFGLRIQFAGRRLPGDEVTIIHGSIDEGRLVGLYTCQDLVTAAVAIGFQREFVVYRRMLREPTTADEAFAQARQLQDHTPVAASNQSPGGER